MKSNLFIILLIVSIGQSFAQNTHFWDDIEATPLIYVLDKDKRIIAKKIRALQIPLVL